jgi:hypothetical protein
MSTEYKGNPRGFGAVMDEVCERSGHGYRCGCEEANADAPQARCVESAISFRMIWNIVCFVVTTEFRSVKISSGGDSPEKSLPNQHSHLIDADESTFPRTPRGAIPQLFPLRSKCSEVFEGWDGFTLLPRQLLNFLSEN